MSTLQPVRLAVYGTLMAGERNDVAGEALRSVIRVGPCKIPGTLYDAGAEQRYPGLVLAGAGLVSGELWELGATAAEAAGLLRALDRYEGYDACAPHSSEYVRHFVHLTEPPVGAWVYVLNKDPGAHNLAPIRSGDWRSYRAKA